MTVDQYEEGPEHAVECEEDKAGAGYVSGLVILFGLMLLMTIRPMQARSTTVVCQEVRQ